MTLFIGGHMDGRDVDASDRQVVDFAVAPPIAVDHPQHYVLPYRREFYQIQRYIIDGEEIAVYVLVGLDPRSAEMRQRVADAVRRATTPAIHGS